MTGPVRLGQFVQYRDKDGHEWPALVVGVKPIDEDEDGRVTQKVDLRVLGDSDKLVRLKGVDSERDGDSTLNAWFQPA